MKETFTIVLSVLLIILYFFGIGLIVWKLGIQLPIEMWNTGNQGWAVIQALLVFSYVLTLGGNRK